MISTDLGVVTAYGYAKDHDWQGTEEEFGEYLANVATNAQAAATAATTAVNAKDAILNSIDSTLSISGKAAESKTTGDKISVLNDSVERIAHGVNLIPLQKKVTTVGGVDRTYENGHVIQSGTCNTTIYAGRLYPITDSFKLNAGTYCLWCYPNYIGVYMLCKSNGDAVGFSNENAITISEQGDYYIAYNGYTQGTVYSDDTYVQLELGEKTEFHLPSDTLGIDKEARHKVAVLSDYNDSFLSTYRIILGEVATYTGVISPSELRLSRRTGLIKTKPGDAWDYYGRGDYQIAAAAYYTDGSFVSYESTEHEVGWKTFTIPAGCDGVIFSSYDTDDFDVVPKSPMTSINMSRLYVPNWSDKKWCAIGDSITAKYGAPYADEKQYWEYIKEETGIKFVNCATSGMGYKNGEDAQHLDAFYQKANVNRYPDLANADVITIFGSVNDCAWDYTLGNVTDNTTSTVCGCINKTIDNLYVCNYAAVIGIITPAPTAYRYPSNAQEYMTLYCEKIVEICNRRSIPCLDLYHESGCHPWDETFKEEMYINSGDGIHPNARGHKIIYPKVREFIGTLI